MGALKNRGVTYAALGRHARAVEDFTEALRLNPKNAEAYKVRGLSFRALGQAERAAADFARAKELDPNLPPP